jgi:SAM-dependent methyltransferase
MDNNAKAWGEYADEYNANATFSSKLIHTGLGLAGISPPAVIKSSVSILDIGCGNGINTALLAQYAKGNVVGIDPVISQIRSATDRFVRDNLRFICCEFREILDYLTEKSYDLVVFFGSIDYIKVDEYFFATLGALTHSSSRCFISKFHPFWTTLYGNDVAKEMDNKYFDYERADKVSFGNSKFIRYHYSLSDYLARFASHGWKLTEYTEPKPDLDGSSFAYKGYEKDPTLQQRLNKIPMTAVFEFIRES